ncbi:unnamed protein product [Echinostoma caproni]|uniref:AMP-binding domain-containing protein n=1 Tax=Echinostoma caproni TaxID=27848 RepID=A0A183AKT6_9TREM|nr:unnamed protein product [Echinostoma caproni]
MVRGKQVSRRLQIGEEKRSRSEWFRTGDIGFWTESGSLQVVGKCHNVFQLADGRFVSPEKIETIYSGSPMVKSVYLHGMANARFAICLAVAEVDEIREEGKRIGVINENDFTSRQPQKSQRESTAEELCRNLKVRRMVLSRLNSIGERKGLETFEMAKSILLVTEEMTIENGLLTVGYQLARDNIRSHYQKQIDELYAEGELMHM